MGYILAWFSMLPFIYIVSLCTLIAFRRDIQTVESFCIIYDLLEIFCKIDNVFCWFSCIWNNQSLPKNNF